MKELLIETGLEEFRLNDRVTVTFNPTDAAFAEKLYKQFEDLEEKQDEYERRISDAKNTPEIFDIGRELDKEMRGKLNAVFDEDICTPLFGNINVYAMAGGMPVWANLMTALIDEMDETATRESRLSKEKVEKYTKKYTGSKYHK